VYTRGWFFLELFMMACSCRFCHFIHLLSLAMIPYVTGAGTAVA
jgi:hypothetical protein